MKDVPMWYVVTEDSYDGTFIRGDHISFNKDGSVSCIEAGGWVEAEDFPEASIGLKYEPDTETMGRKIAELMKQINRLEVFIDPDTPPLTKRLEILTNGIKAVSELIHESDGVCGLHLNGDAAPWEDLQDWLLDFNAAERVI